MNMFRVSVKHGSGWFIVYEGNNRRKVDEIIKRYNGNDVSIERI